MNILITGCNGQLGNEMQRLEAAHPEHTWMNTDVDELDITNQLAVEHFIAHHQIDGITPELLVRADVGDAAPFYLLNGAVLQQDVKKGQPVTLKDVDLSGLSTYALFLEGLKLG